MSGMVGVPLHGTQSLGSGNQYSLRIVSSEGSWKCQDCGCDQFGEVSETELCMVCDAQVKIVEAEEATAVREKAASDRAILGIDFHGEPEEEEVVEVKKEKPLSHAQLASMSRKARAEHGSGGSHVPLGNHGTERKRMPLPVYKKSKKPARPAVSPDGTMEVVFNEKILGIHVDDREWEVGPKPKIVVTKVQENGTLAGARENWAVEAVNGVSMEELGLATHSELQTYIVSIPLRPLTLTLKTPPRPPTELELEELREAEEAKRAAEEQAKREAAEAAAKAEEERLAQLLAEEEAQAHYHKTTPLKKHFAGEEELPRKPKIEHDDNHPIFLLQTALFGHHED